MSRKVLSILTILLALGLILFVGLFVREQTVRTRLDAELSALSADVEAKAAEIEALTADAAEQGETIESLTADAAEQGEAIESLTADAAAKDAEIESLTAEAATKDAALKSLNAEAETRAAAIDTLNAAVEGLTADVAARDAAIETLNAEAEARSAELEGLSAELESLNAEAEALRAALAEREERIGALEGEITELVGVVPTEFPCETDAMKFFLSACAEHGLACLYRGLDAEGCDCAALTVRGAIDCKVAARYDPESRTFRFTARPCASFAQIDRPELLELCNVLNLRYRNISFYLDDWDNTVSAESLAVLTQDRDGETAAFPAFRDLLDALAENEEAFLPYVF